MKIKTIAMLWAACLSGFFPLYAFEKTIRGKITDATDGLPVFYAQISFYPSDSMTLQSVRSDPEGYFEISLIETESCVLSISLSGYQPYTLPLSALPPRDTLSIALIPTVSTLDEVVVRANSIRQEPDRTILLPTSEQLRTATHGADLLRKMQLPRLMVDPVTGEITQSGKGGEVQLRINGIQVTTAEINVLAPADILRIEYHEDPGARYGQARAVIDFITHTRDSGGHFSGTLMKGFGRKKNTADEQIALKFYHGKSEFSAHASFIQRKQDWTRDYHETLVFPTYTLQRREQGEPTDFNKKVFQTQMNFSVKEKDRFFANAQLRYNLTDFPNSFENRKSILSSSDSDQPVQISDLTWEKSHSPALDLYAQIHLAHGQMLIFNVVGTYIDTESHRIYEEKQGEIPQTRIISEISGNKYSLFGEGIYERKFRIHTFNAGIRHLQAYTKNFYSGSSVGWVSLRQAESSLYSEYSMRLGPWGLIGSLTATRLYDRQKDHFTEKFIWHPSVWGWNLSRICMCVTKSNSGIRFLRWQYGTRWNKQLIPGRYGVEIRI